MNYNIFLRAVVEQLLMGRGEVGKIGSYSLVKRNTAIIWLHYNLLIIHLLQIIRIIIKSISKPQTSISTITEVDKKTEITPHIKLITIIYSLLFSFNIKRTPRLHVLVCLTNVQYSNNFFARD